MSNTPATDPTVPVVDYYGPKCVLPHARAPGRIATMWLIPVAVQLLGWLLVFQPFPNDGPAVYVRNFAAGITGIPLFVGSFAGVVPPNDLMVYSLLAIVTWTVLLMTATTVARRLPLLAHLALSSFWNLSGWLLYLVLCF